jgi:hypothetical protein
VNTKSAIRFSRYGFLIATILLGFLTGVIPAAAVTQGQMMVQVNPVPATLAQGDILTITGTAPQVLAQQLQVWLVRGDAAWVSGTPLQFDGSFTIVINTSDIAPGSYGLVIEAPYNGKYPVTYDPATQSAIITTTRQSIYQFTPASTIDGPSVAQTIVSTCTAVGADRNCVPLSFTVLPPLGSATQAPVPTTAVPASAATHAPLSAFGAIGGLALGAVLLMPRNK